MSENKFPFQLLYAMKTNPIINGGKLFLKNYQYYMLEYVVEGAGFVEYEKKKYYCPKDSIYFFQPGKDYCYYHDTKNPWIKIYIIFDGEFASHMVKAYDLEDKLFFSDQKKCLPYFKEFLLLKYNSHEKASLLIHNIFSQMTLQQNPEASIHPAALELKIALECSVNQKFILKDFAISKGISITSLISKFKEHYQCTPYEYLLQCRLNSACNMLEHTNLSLKEIASMLNFSDQYYFSNLFKQRKGLSPSKFRRQFK